MKRRRKIKSEMHGHRLRAPFNVFMKIRMRVIDFDVGKTEGTSGQHNFPQRLLIMITPSFVYLFKKMLQQTLKTILSMGFVGWQTLT